MKKMLKPASLVWFVPVMGLLCAAVRFWLFSTGMDEKNLLASSHPGHFLTWGITVVTLIVIVLGTWDLKQAHKYQFNFPARTVSAVGAGAAAVGILISSLAELFGGGDAIACLDAILGILSAAALGFLAWCRMQGKHPSVLFHTAICIYLMIHLVCQYRLWSSDPQIQDYCFSLLSIVSLMLANYYSAGFDANAGQRQPHAAFHLAAVYFSLVSLPHCDSPLFFLAMAVWMLTDLCNLTPMPREAR